MNRKLSVLTLMVLMTLVIGASGATAHGTAAPVDPSSPAVALGTEFTYQGYLTDGDSPASGTFDFRFRLYDDPDIGEGTLLDTVLVGDEPVTDGLFTVELDFGDVFDGTALYLEVGVRAGSSSGAYTTLSPRQALTPTPYAIYTMNALWSGLDGVPAGFADGIDDNTTYTAGTGLTLSSGQFSVNFGSSGSASTAARSDHGHDDQYYTETELQTSGSADVHWGNLTSVPAGFADGTDDNTTYTAGLGLDLTGTEFSVVTDTMQLRVSGDCTAGSTVRVINADGTVVCETDDNTTYTAGEGLALKGSQFSARGSSYDNVVVVARSGGDYTSVQSALDSIADAAVGNPYLVWVAPGVYSETVTMKAWVDIEGAGELVTKITTTGSSSDDTGTVVGVDNAELRFMTVENTGGEDYAIAIYNDGQSPRLTHLTASASGGTNSYGVSNNNSSSPTMTNVTATASGGAYSYGVYNYSSSPQMTDVTATGSGGTNFNYGVYNYYSSPTMTNMAVSASGGTNSRGVYNNRSSSTINNSVIEGSGGTTNYGIYNIATSGFYIVTVNNSQITGSTNTIRNHSRFTTYVGASLLAGGAVAPYSGTVTCAGVYDESYSFSASSCP